MKNTINSNRINPRKKLTPLFCLCTAFFILFIWNAYDIVIITIQQSRIKDEIQDLKQENEILNEEIFQLQKELQQNR
ncbi:hypothetical protein [Aureispira anguillae]|uniref:Septum formation initiator n=1 Tax=Aureispira anguillae TaxID=2864201 RepID=A0A916DUM4_9BACT|nr:hypothetical protein [Aureispira anguillae]BDS12371.1 hypothetical protein AsAng_0030920 [Aureispira anguillae]